MSQVRLARRPRRRTGSQPQVGWPMVERALRRLRLWDAIKARLVLQAFTKACGARLLQHARPERFAAGTLHVRVQSSAWATEIAFAQAEILTEMRKFSGGETVRALRFNIGPLEDVPVLTDPAPPVPVPLPPSPIDARVAAALTHVPDDELRDLLGGLYVSACKAGRTRPGAPRGPRRPPGE